MKSSQRVRRRLGMLRLETRVTPSTFTVTAANDEKTDSDGKICLREAINLANNSGGADEIVFDTLFGAPQTVTLVPALKALEITETLTITGPGQGLLNVSGGDAVNVFVCKTGSGTSVTVTGLTVSDGRLTKGDEFGAGIFATSTTLNLTDVTVRDCTSAADGAGVYVDSGSDGVGGLFAKNCTFTGNTIAAPGTVNTAVLGTALAVANAATLEMKGCTVTGNSGESAAAGSDVFGAVGLFNFTTATISDCVISNNSADGQAGVMQLQPCDLEINRTTFDGNTTTAGAGAALRLNVFDPYVVAVNDCTFSNNYAANSGGAIAASTGDGTVFVRNSTFSGNVAVGNGGAVRTFGTLSAEFNFLNCTFTNNSANGLGGGVSESTDGGSNAVIKFESCVIAGNSAGSTGDLSGTISQLFTSVVGARDGSTISNIKASAIGTKAAPIDAKLSALGFFGGPTRVHLPLAGSPAIDTGSNPAGLSNDQRGMGFPRKVNGFVDAGAAESNPPNPPYVAFVLAPDVTAKGGTTTQFNLTFADDTGIKVSTLSSPGAVSVSGGAFPSSVAAQFKSVDVGTDGTPRTATYEINAPGGTFDVTDNGNYTIEIAGAKVFDTDAPAQSVFPGAVGGFRVAIPRSFVVDATNDEVADTDGKTSLREALTAANDSPGADTITFAPAMFASPKTITLEPTSDRIDITDSVTIAGPAALVTVDGGGKVSLLNINGKGIIQVSIAGLRLANGNEASNVFGRGGGAAFVSDEVVTFKNVVFEGNTSLIAGGAVHLAGPGVITFEKCDFMTNTATAAGQGGGAVALASSGTVNLNACSLSGNTAENGSGGAVLALQSGTVNITDTYVFANTAQAGGSSASGFGGGVSLADGGTLNVSRSTLENNTAGRDGGGVYAFAPAGYLVSNSTVAANTAGRDGGGLMVRQVGIAAAVQNSTIAYNSASGGSLGGGGLAVATVGTGGSFIVSSTIVAKNTNGVSPDFNADAALNVPGNDNLFGDPTGSKVTLTGTSNLNGDPNLAATAKFNGGPTPTVALLPGSQAVNNGNNTAKLSTDQRGAARVVGTSADIGAYEFGGSVAPARVSKVEVNGGSGQRSRVTTVRVTFDQIVTLPGSPAAAFGLVQQPGGTAVNLVGTVTTGKQTVVDLIFVGGAIHGPGGMFVAPFSLLDGRFTLTVFASQVNGGVFDGDGNGVGGDDYVLVGSPANGLFRLFGDSDGDADTDASDLGAFRPAFGGSTNLSFDFEGDGDVDAVDYGQFRPRFGSSI